MSVNLDELLPYYQAEMEYLRRSGSAFAARYPKLAARLELSREESPDPHVERLLESFAFLAARLQHRLDSQFPEITTALLGALHPHLVSPIPPMAIAQFQADPAQGKLNTGFPIPKFTKLFAQTADGLTCRFRTCYPVELWPIEIVEAGFAPKTHFDFLRHHSRAAGVLRLRLAARGTRFSALDLKRLRIHLSGDTARVEALLELIFARTLGVAVGDPGAANPKVLPPEAILPVGFGLDEEVIPYPANVHPASRLIQEYFHFPEKFSFFDLDGIGGCAGGEVMEVLLILSHPPGPLKVDAANFNLGCAPIINLFSKTTEPVRVDHRTLEYRLVADMRRERSTEIHSIVSVSASSNPGEKRQELEPFYSLRHRMQENGPRAFWHARRVRDERPDLPGTEMRLSFVDLNFKPAEPSAQVVYAHTLCTNRDLAEQLPAGALLQTEEKAPLHRIHCLGKPTGVGYPPLGGAALWALVSGLSLNYLSLTGAEGLDALKSMLRLFGASASTSAGQQVEAMREMSCRPVVRRLGGDAWRGFCPGTEITLTLDDHAFLSHGAYLFGAVLQHYLALHASLNSFTQLVLQSAAPGGGVIRFGPRAGAGPLL